VNYETARPDPVGIYDATKLMAETLCQAYRKSFHTDVASIRTSFVFGHRHSTGDYFVGRCLADEKNIAGVGRDHPCEFTYVNDLALGLVLAAEAPRLNHGIYNVAAGVTRTRGELARIIMGVFPDVSIDLVEGIDPERHLRGPCSIDRAREDFGFVPRFSLEDGVADWIRVGGRMHGKIGKH
jgi:nucleoside-diphosphate-sugar epimerase